MVNKVLRSFMGIAALCLLVLSPAAAGGDEEIASSPRTADRAAALIESGDPDKALELTEAALAERADDVDLLLLKGRVLRKLKRHGEAAEVYKRVLAVDPANEAARNILTLLLVEQARRADAQKAPYLMAEALRLSGNAPGIIEEAIELFARCGRHAEAVTLYESAAAGKAMPREPTRAVADSYHHRGRYGEAARLYEAILRADPTDREAALALVLVRMDAGEYEAAIEAARLSLERQPASVNLLMTMAAVQWLSGDRPAANVTLDRVLAIAPEHAGAAGLKVELLLEMGCLSPAADFVSAHTNMVSRELMEDLRRRRREMEQAWSEGARGESPGGAVFTAVSYAEILHCPADEPSALSVDDLVEQIEFLRWRGIRFLKGLDLLQAAGKHQDLPGRSVLLVFEGPCKSFSTAVLPILELYDCPAVLAVCSSWVEDGPPAGVESPIMTWEEIRGLADHKLLSLGSLTHRMNQRVSSDAAGGRGSAATTRIYSVRTGRYESDEAYRSRIARDLRESRDYIRVRTGSTPYLLFWPFGVYNKIGLEEARRVGFFSLADLRSSGPAPRRAAARDRWIVGPGTTIREFAEGYAEYSSPPAPLKSRSRAFRVSMDLLAGDAPDGIDGAVTKLAERARKIGVDTVYLKAFSEIGGADQVDRAYFPNRLLPVKDDLLAGVTAAIREQGFEVHICVPVLGIGLPGEYLKPSLQVMESKLGSVRVTTTRPLRLSPFSQEALALVKSIYTDLAAHVALDGIVFLEDAFLTDDEDFNPGSIDCLRDLGTTEINPRLLSVSEKARWTRLKTRQIDGFVAVLMEVVREYRPNAVFSRVLYAPALHSPEASEEWLAQRFESAARNYDRVIVLTDPEAENVKNEAEWLGVLTSAAGARGAMEKTVFMFSAYNHFSNRWLSERIITRRIETMIENGARHIAYSPDDYRADRPDWKPISRVILEGSP